jgi:hypothetical protein
MIIYKFLFSDLYLFEILQIFLEYDEPNNFHIYILIGVQKFIIRLGKQATLQLNLD